MTWTVGELARIARVSVRTLLAAYQRAAAQAWAAQQPGP
ncbi:hypothetical protein Deipe_2479 [Deinococcus peraridilitoris DSM 19664]|uniref:Uncharacterized protein n=1 Tax=Deinococcus peraridilitoris (strain DSM 19664 / LMG 22246 / CIP 109416 / KR-200) TaxID=937777 RepID=L0A274_DEIPD|nr:hypothetical protein Deipe_2479 [Deinococcus peraridilitoris DSM 19664]